MEGPSVRHHAFHEPILHGKPFPQLLRRQYDQIERDALAVRRKQAPEADPAQQRRLARLKNHKKVHVRT